MPYPGKLSHRQRIQLCAWLAIGESPSQAAAKCQETFGVRISAENVHQNYLSNDKWKRVIDRFRHRLETRISDIPIAHKAVRLRRLEDAVQYCLLWREREVRDRKGRLLGTIQFKDIRALIRLLEQARREMEGYEAKPNARPENPSVSFVDGMREIIRKRGARLPDEQMVRQQHL